MRRLQFALVLALSVLEFAHAARAQESAPADPRRPAAMRATGVPVVPAQVAERLRHYQSARQAVFLGWAPDGRGMLIQTRFGNAMQLHRVYVPGGRREQITFFDEPVTGRFLPAAKDGAVLASMSRGGNENDQVYLLDLARYQVALLTDGESRNELGPVHHDGSRAIVASNRRNGRDTDLYAVDCRQPGKNELLLETDGQFWVPQDWSQDGARLALIRYVSINESYPALFDVAAKKLSPLALPGEGPAAVGSMAFTPDGKSAYIATDAKGEFLQLARVDLETGEYAWLAPDLQWDVTDVEVESNTGRVAILANEDGAGRIYLLENDKLRRIDTPLGLVDNLDFSPDGASLGFTLARPDAPAEAYSADVATGELQRWTFSETGGVDPGTFVAPERIQFSSFDGRQIPAYYFRPRNAKAQDKAPVLIDIHGGPEAQYRPIFSPINQYLLREQGVAIIHPNVRGSAGYGKSYLLLDNAEKREDSVRDIGALLDWIAQQPELDSQRVAVTGGSYGGYMVLASLVHYSDRLKAGIDIVGIANFVTFLENTSPYRRDLRRAEYGDERKPEMRAAFERINPSANAEKIRAALLVAHGVNDPRVPFSEAEQIVAKVRGAGRPVWTVYAENEGHGFAKKDNRDYLTAVMTLFLAEQLK